MKKVFVSIFAFLYISIACGASVQLHYCMGRIVNWDLWYAKERKCGKCGMEKENTKDNGCCKDEYKQFRFDKDQQTNSGLTTLNIPIAIPLPLSVIELPHADFGITIKTAHYSNAPPGINGPPLYIRNCIFLI